MSKYQSPNKWLPLLPYNEKLYSHTDDYLDSILRNLALSIRRRDLKVSGSFYISQLQRYYNLFHLRFTKETHISLINLLYQVVTVPNLELIIVLRAANLLASLLKKKKLLTRDDLKLDWKPLYKLWRFVDYSTYETCGLIYVPSDITKHIKNLVKACRSYFPLDATREMLEEWKPWLCAYDTKMQDAFTMMDSFLPTDLPPEIAKTHGYGLWLDDIVKLWLTSPSKFGWHTQVVTILARLAWDLCGILPWSSHLDVIFSDLLCSFSIPVGTSQLSVTVKGHTGDPEILAFFIAALIGPHKDGEKCLEALQHLCTAVTTHMHPSNNGKWQQSIVSFVVRFTQLVVLRWRRENHTSEEKHWWYDYTPKEARLTEEILDRIAVMILPLAECSAFSKSVQSDVAVTPLVNLLQLSPRNVMPTVLANLDSSLETLTEPHRLYSSLRVAASAVVYLAADKCCDNGGARNPTEGLPPPSRNLIVPLLLNLLPGIDPNDLRKTYLCGQILALTVMQVPLVDCSNRENHGDETDNDILQGTSQFEEFITSFMDRFFQLVEAVAHSGMGSSPTANERQSIEEQALEEGLTPLLSLIVGQSDKKLKQIAVDYLFRWVMEHRLDAVTSGRIIAKLCQATASAAQSIYTDRFVPVLVDKIDSYFNERPGLMEEEKLDNDMLWFLAILSQSCAVDGEIIVTHVESLKRILKWTLLARCRKTSAIAVAMLRHLLKSLTRIYPMENTSLEESDFEKTEQGTCNFWGYFYKLNDVHLKWHVPKQHEFEAARSVIDELFLPSYNWLDDYAKGKQENVQREVLEQHVRIVRSFVRCLAPVLPFWTEDGDNELVTDLVECAVPLNSWPIFAGYDTETTATMFSINGSNMRRSVLQLAERLIERIRISNEDFAKPLVEVIGMIETVLLDGGQQKNGRTDTALRVNDMMSRYMQPFLPVAGEHRKYHRLWLVDRVDVQHQNIVSNSRPRVFSKLHEEAILNLFRLTMHYYSEVRKAAQQTLHASRAGYPYSYRCIMEPLCYVIKNCGDLSGSKYEVWSKDADNDNRLKGALYDILGSSDQCLVTKRSWQILADVLPLLIELRLPEKPSLQDLIDRIVDRFDSTFETFTLTLEHPKALLDAAEKLYPNSDSAFDGAKFELENNQQWLKSFDTLNNRLSAILSNSSLPSRSLLIGLDFLRYLLRYDFPCDKQLVETVLKLAIGDTPQQATLCVDALLSVCRQIRRRPVKVVHTFSSENAGKILPGERADNAQFLYDPNEDIWDNPEKWKKQAFIDKTYLGFSCWAKEVACYSGSTVLDPVVNLDKSDKGMTEVERTLFSYFCRETSSNNGKSKDVTFLHEFIDQLVHQIHANDGSNFMWKIVYIFKILLRLFYPVLLPMVLDQIDRLIGDEQPSSAPSSQAVAAELFAAVIRASKFWPRDVIEKLSHRLTASLDTALKKMTADWEDCWVNSFSTLASFGRLYRRHSRLVRIRAVSSVGSLAKNTQRLAQALGGRHGRKVALAKQRVSTRLQQQKLRPRVSGLVAGDYDPRRIHWLISWMLKDWTEGASQERSAAGEATRLSLLQALVEQTEWRAPALKRLVFDRIVKSAASPYKSVRQRAGQFVAAILTTDPTWLHNGQLSKLPTWEQFTSELGTIVINWVQSLGSPQSESQESLKEFVLNSPEFTKSKLMMEVLGSSVGSVVTRIPVCLISLLPPCLALDALSMGIDEELRALAITSSAILGMGRLDTEPARQTFISTIQKLCKESPSWQTRRQTLCVTQVSTFHNIYLLRSSSISYASLIRQLLVESLNDPTVEVREMASVTLSGLFQCGFFEPETDLITKFNQLALVRVPKIGTNNRDVVVRQRHAGVLGLAAVVSASPYSVPKFLPEVLLNLTDHVGDPPPIAATARRALTDFRRTHHDQWFVHRVNFTEDQLAALSSVLVSPNYYA